jgi:hypothetical protein
MIRRHELEGAFKPGEQGINDIFDLLTDNLFDCLEGNPEVLDQNGAQTVLETLFLL